MAAVFLWFSINKFLHPSYWINAWVPDTVMRFLGGFKISGIQFIYLLAIFEILIGISLITNIFPKFFSILAVVFLISTIFFAGISEVTVRDLGLIGGFIAIILWPEHSSRF